MNRNVSDARYTKTHNIIFLFVYQDEKHKRFYILIRVLHLQRIHAEVSHYISIQTVSSVIG